MGKAAAACHGYIAYRPRGCPNRAHCRRQRDRPSPEAPSSRWSEKRRSCVPQNAGMPGPRHASPERRETVDGDQAQARCPWRGSHRSRARSRHDRAGGSARCGAARSASSMRALPGTMAPSEIRMMRVGSSAPRLGSMRRREKRGHEGRAAEAPRRDRASPPRPRCHRRYAVRTAPAAGRACRIRRAAYCWRDRREG